MVDHIENGDSAATVRTKLNAMVDISNTAGDLVTRSINTSGLASGGGNLSADRTISVPAASNAEALAGTVTTKAVTPANLGALMTDRAVNTAGLATGGGNLTTSRTITVAAADDAAAIAGAATNSAVTPHSLGAALGTAFAVTFGGSVWPPVTAASGMYTLYQTLTIGQDAAGRFAIRDPYGFVSFAVGADGAPSFAGCTFRADPTADGIVLRDPYGFRRPVAASGGSSSSGDGFSAADIAAWDAWALAVSSEASLKDELVARLKPGINHINIYGQSLSIEASGTPTLTKVNPLPSLLMVGQATRGWGASGIEVFQPFGTAEFNPAVAANTADDDVLTDAEVTDPGMIAADRGGDMAVAFILQLKRAWNMSQGRAPDDDDPAVKIVVTSCGQGGKRLDELAKGAAQEIYARMISAAEIVKGLAAADSLDYHYTGTLYVQGEADYEQYTARSAYEAGLRQMRADITADVAVGVAGQSDLPFFVTVEPSGQFANDDDGPTGPQSELRIGNAHLALSDSEPGWLCATGYYMGPDVGGHVTANTYRWVGCLAGRATADMIVWRRKPARLRMLQPRHRSREVLVPFDVPAPPIRWGEVYEMTALAPKPQRGFRATDAAGNIPLTAQIVGRATVRLLLDREPSGTLVIWLGDKTVNTGSTNIRDSDPREMPFAYEYNPYAPEAENIAELVGQKYDSSNWALCASMASMEG